jgi:hypothetical protein
LNPGIFNLLWIEQARIASHPDRAYTQRINTREPCARIVDRVAVITSNYQPRIMTLSFRIDDMQAINNYDIRWSRFVDLNQYLTEIIDTRKQGVNIRLQTAGNYPVVVLDRQGHCGQLVTLEFGQRYEQVAIENLSRNV